MLTEVKIRATKRAARLKKLSDGGGLQLWITPDGAKRWRLAYRFAGVQKLLALGVYPKTGLRDARERRDEAKRVLRDGQDPCVVKKLKKAAKAAASANTFDAIAAELLAKKRAEKKAGRTLSKTKWLLSLASPAIGTRPISEVSAAEVLNILQTIEARGRHETAHRLRATLSAVFRYAVVTEKAETDPTRDLRGALVAPTTKHRSAIIQPKAFGGLLRAVAGYDGAPETRIALELLALTFVRPGELRTAEWQEFDLDAALWIIPPGRMKMRREHRVPLAPQAVALLTELQAITGRGKFLFPSLRSPARCMSENTMNAALRRLGYSKDQMSSHGFRAAASSILNESGLWNPDAIERQLAHADHDAIRAAYARAEFWDERVKMMQWWAAHCAKLRDGADQRSIAA